MKRIKFNQWWTGIKTHPVERQQEIITQWLKYAEKTVALRGDQDQQRVVYTIRNRWRNSKWPRLTRENARRVYRIVNNKQLEYKRTQKRITELERALEAKTDIKSAVIIKRNRSKKIITNK